MTGYPGGKKTPGRLKWRFFTHYTAAGVITVLLLSSLLFFYVRTATIQAFQEDSQKVLDRYESRLQEVFKDEIGHLLFYHRLLGEDYLEDFPLRLGECPRYLDAFILDDRGRVIYAWDSLVEGYDYSGKEAYQQALHRGEPFTLTRFHPVERRLSIDMVIPIYQGGDRLVYVAVYQMDPHWLEKRLSLEYFADEGEILMFNREGLIFFTLGGHEGSRGNREDLAPARLPSLKGYGFSLSHLEGLGEGPQSFLGEDYLVTYKAMEGDLGIIANRMSLGFLGEHLRRIFSLMGLGLALGLLVFAFLGTFVARLTMGPIYDITRQVEETLQGKRDFIEEGKPAELSVLVEAFNQSWQDNLETQQELKGLAEEHERVFNGTRDAMFLIGVSEEKEFRYIRNNQAHQEETGISLEELQGKTPRELLGPALGEQLTMNYRACLEKGAPLTYEETLDLPGGERTWTTTLTPVYRGTKIRFLVGSSQDITERKEMEVALRLSEERYRLLVENAAEGIAVAQDGFLKYTNPLIQKKIGYTGEEISKRPFIQFIHPPEQNLVLDKLAKIQDGDDEQGKFSFRAVSRHGEISWMEVSGVAVEWEGRPAVLGFMNDITERKQNQEKLEYLSLHDALTGLYNRAFFDEETRRLTGSREYPVTVISADLDGLKLINDTMGHARGDQLIKASAGLLLKSLRNSDILARIGGDEFAVLLPRTDKSTGEIIARRIRSQVELHNGEHPELPLSISIGVATAEESSTSLEDTYIKADDLMYREKLERKDAVRSHTVDILLNALSMRNYPGGEHAHKVSMYCLTLADKLNLPEEQLIELALLSQLHNLGMVAIPESIIMKKGPLTPEERELVRQHPEKGYRIASSSPELADMAGLILKQQEWWDGSGHPRGLKGEEIPLPCRILAVANAYAAMTSPRPYRDALTGEEALSELKKGAGNQFDPALVGLFEKVIPGAQAGEYIIYQNYVKNKDK